VPPASGVGPWVSIVTLFVARHSVAVPLRPAAGARRGAPSRHAGAHSWSPSLTVKSASAAPTRRAGATIDLRCSRAVLSFERDARPAPYLGIGRHHSAIDRRGRVGETARSVDSRPLPTSQVGAGRTVRSVPSPAAARLARLLENRVHSTHRLTMVFAAALAVDLDQADGERSDDTPRYPSNNAN
jgi:hypothetical protein